jgi:hypothetical protein
MNSLVKNVKVKEQTPEKRCLIAIEFFSFSIREFVRIYSKKVSKHTQFVVFLLFK